MNPHGAKRVCCAKNVFTLVSVCAGVRLFPTLCSVSVGGYAAVAVLFRGASRQVVVHVALLRPFQELALDEVLDALLDHLGRW
jgi:predicted esterase YcpF (UPF0227 family)